MAIRVIVRVYAVRSPDRRLPESRAPARFLTCRRDHRSPHPRARRLGQFLNHAATTADAIEPADLMARAIELAAADAGLASVPEPDSIRVVSLLTWKYGDPALIVAQHLGLSPRRDGRHPTGGNSAAEPRQHDRAGDPRRRRSTSRSSPVARLADPSAGPARRGTTSTGRRPRRAPYPHDRRGARDEPPGRARPRHHHAGAGLPDVRDGGPRPRPARPSTSTSSRSASCGRGSARWPRATRTPGCVRPSRPRRSARPAPKNRMIGLPYTKYMNSNNDVDMAAALIMCSVEQRSVVGHRRGPLGVPASRAPTATSTSSSPTAGRSPRRRPSSSAAGAPWSWPGRRSTTSTLVDLYSCFPSAVQLGAQSLGLGARPPAHPHRRPVVRRRAVEQLRDARHRHGDGRPARRHRARTGWCGPTAATPPSTRSASTRRTRRHSRSSHAYPQDADRRHAPPGAGRRRTTPPDRRRSRRTR